MHHLAFVNKWPSRFQYTFPSNNIPLLLLSVLLLMLGVLFVFWSNLYFLFKGNGGPADIAGFTISPQTKRLVIDGPYKHSRNPMVFGANAIYLSIALYLNSLGSLFLLLFF